MERGSLRDYQIEDLAFSMVNSLSANLSDPGTGKTPTTCAWQSWLWFDKGIKTAWPQPKSLLEKNRKELLKFSDFEETDVVIIDGTPSQRAAQMARPAKAFLMGFNRFSSDWRLLKQLHPQLKAVASDEIHMGYGGHTSKRTQGLYQAMDHMDWFLPMTGTLINGRLSSAYPVIRIIEPRYYASYESFLVEHAVRDWFDNIIAWKNHDKIAKILERHTVRRSFESVYGPEAKVIVPEEVPLSPKQRKLYDEFEKTALIELDDAFLAAGEPGVAAIRCRQIMAHPEKIPHPSGLGTVDLMDGEMTGKDERLLVHLEDHKNSGKPLVIFSALIPEQERILALVRKQGMTAELINGNVSAARRAQIDRDFQAGKFQVVVGSPATASVGFNWGHVDHIIFASMDYQDSSFVQAYRRAIRGKRSTPLLITILQYEQSIDQRIMQIVEVKSLDAHTVDPTYQKLVLAPPKPPLVKPSNGKFDLRSL